MKAVYNIVLVLAAAITLSLSGCNPTTELTATPDELSVVATAEVAQTEPTTVPAETTLAEVGENTIPETTATEATEPTEVQEPEKAEDKSVNNSSDKQQNDSNNSSSSTSNNKPSNNGGNGSQTTNKPAETKPEEDKPVVITDDTIIPYEQICTDTNMTKVTDSVNAYFMAKGMNYTSSLNKDNSGWFFVQMPMLQYDELSVNKLKYMVTDYFDSEVEAVLVGLGGVTDLSLGRFNCYYDVDCNGYYNIYFCYG